MKYKFIPLLVLIIFLSGCWDSNEPERLVYAHGVGVDYKDGKVVVYLQIINLQGLAKTEAGGDPSSQNASDVGTGTGDTLEEAIFDLYHTSDRRIYWGHLSFVIFSDEALNAGGFKKTVDFLDRYRETRYRIFFYMTKESVKEAMLVGPIENIPLAFSKLSDPEGNYKQSSFIPPINLRELIIEMDEPAYFVSIPRMKVTKQWSGQKEKKKDLLLDSIAVISENKIKTIFPTRAMKGARLVNKNFVRDSVTLFPGTRQDTSVIVYEKKVKMKPVIEKDGKVRFHIKMKLKSSIETMKVDSSPKEYERELKRILKKEIKYTYKYAKEKKVDLFRLSETLYRKDIKKWKEIQKDGEIPLEDDTIKSIKIEVNLQNTGKDKLTPIFEDQKDKGHMDR
ncbi:Ger(x)C family spore germination protein [Peribacillus sp. NPDC097264]|uniref:Ger(x)C family spore germination protein n=1 Tax=Peribacillus sp. NPDC097264 TaxID=3390616 RepID=UPI003D04165D